MQGISARGGSSWEDKMAKGGKRPICIAICAFSVICVVLLALTIYFATHQADCHEKGAPMPVSEEHYGRTEDGDEITQYTLKNSNEIVVKIINYGGIITNVMVPDKEGTMTDVTLGFDSYDGGYNTNSGYFGCLVGRYANRIAKGHFTLDGVTYNLTINNPPNALHGGTKGFDKRMWTSKVDGSVLELTYVSADMEEGYPGEVTVKVTYQLTDLNELVINYHATSNKTTIINLTNHGYYNLAGHGAGNLDGHTIILDADHYTPVDNTSIPTGVIASVNGTKFDIQTETDIVSRIPQVPGDKGFDHNYAMGNPGWDKHVARVKHAPSGRQLDVYSTEPGVQFYTGYYLDGSAGKGGATYPQYGAFALEAQHYPDSPNQPNFPNTLLQPGKAYTQTTKYVFSVSDS